MTGERDEAASQSSSQEMKDTSRGLVQGGRGGPEDELLEAGQEEVFSRTEVESGRMEHHSEAGSSVSSTETTGKPLSKLDD